MHRRFTEKGPSIADKPEVRYGNRPIASTRNHLYILSAEVQKFRVALRMIRACNHTGVNDNKIVSMVIAIHDGETKKLEYY